MNPIWILETRLHDEQSANKIRSRIVCILANSPAPCKYRNARQCAAQLCWLRTQGTMNKFAQTVHHKQWASTHGPEHCKQKTGLRNKEN